MDALASCDDTIFALLVIACHCMFLLFSCIMFAVVGDVFCFFHVLSMQHVLYPFRATGKPSREEVAFDECQEKLLLELLQHFEIGVPWLNQKNSLICDPVWMHDVISLRLIVQGH